MKTTTFLFIPLIGQARIHRGGGGLIFTHMSVILIRMNVIMTLTSVIPALTSGMFARKVLYLLAECDFYT
jgi:hypothetical protein